eukprot:TRINITY_DN11432_c0_g2_i3.p2 TRINITY_DN11432_c0_g2~~TRINITY_DN11432_c0_g2_i3.p2  ORF type:complete len:281 (+),score=43.27 TRINITY_DN11432_c0_g2_i3:57-899(+)
MNMQLSFSKQLSGGTKCNPAFVRKYSKQTKRSNVIRGGLGEAFRSFFNFEEWAPKSSRYWRLRRVPWEDGQYMPEETQETKQQDEDFERQVQQLEQRIAKVQEDENLKKQQQALKEEKLGLDSETAAAAAKFSEVSDGEFLKSLNDRISSMDSLDEPDSSEGELTAGEFRQLIKSKYGKSYDVSIARRDIPGKTLVSLNIMWLYLEQKSFSMTPEQYVEKLGGIAYYLNAWGQQDKVRAALREPMKSKRGLPKKPLPGIAVSIQLDLDQSILDEYFGNKW